MADDRRGWVKPRPIRVAFLVQDGEHAAATLDGIFAGCFARWGGRSSVVVPCADNKVPDAYWPWLEVYDPDFVYSYVELSDNDILDLHERLNPSEYILHRLDTEHLRLKPGFDFEPLSALSTLFLMARHATSGPLRIIDTWFGSTPSRTFSDNLGSYHECRDGTFYPADARGAASLLTVVGPKRASPRDGILADMETVPDELAAWREYAEGRALSVAGISLAMAPKLGIHDHRWSTTFNLVVGETFADRVLFWNARLLLPGWLDSDLNCLRVTLADLRDPQFLDMLGELLRRRNRVNGGSGGQTYVTVRSTSLTDDELAEAKTLIDSTKTWSLVRSEKVTSPDEVIPDGRTLNSARETSIYLDAMFSSPDWTTFAWAAPAAKLPFAGPRHLADAPPRQLFAQGYWAVDVSLESVDEPHGFGDRNIWKLPQRWRMAGAFRTSRPHAPNNDRAPAARRSRGGNLTIFVSAASQVDTVTVPTVEAALRHALTYDGHWAAQRPGKGKIVPPVTIGDMDPSNVARALNGTVGMTGSLAEASQYLLHPFLMEMFAALGGTTALSAQDVTPTVNRLQREHQRRATFWLKEPQERTVLANLIVNAAKQLKRPAATVSFETLRTDWVAHRAALKAKHPEMFQGMEEDDDRDEERSLEGCLISMRQRKMLFQGCEWQCGNCHHRNWVDIGGLSSEFECEVCGTEEVAPVTFDWLFRPNEFLIDSLRDHAIQSLVWVLRTYARNARDSFHFFGPTVFKFERDAVKPDIEADLLVITNGRTSVFEVKASWSILRRHDITKLVSLAKRLRPDEAVLAVMENGGKLADEIAAATAELAEVGIRFRLLKPSENEDWEASYLPS